MQRLQKCARVTGDLRVEIRDECARRYAEGASLRELATATGRSVAWVRTILAEAGVEIRRSGPRPRTE